MLGSGKSATSSPKEQRKKGAEKPIDPIRRLGKKIQTFLGPFCCFKAHCAIAGIKTL